MKVDSFAYSKDNKAYWSCTCLACNTSGHVVRGGDLKSGRTASCGCKKSISKGAKKVKSILQNNNIFFIPEYHFDDLKSNNNKNLYFDFAIFDNDKLIYLIEYDGEQHYTYQNSTKTWNTKEHFLQIKERDNLKNEYCKKNNILLYRIPYYDIGSINQLDELINKKYLV